MRILIGFMASGIAWIFLLVALHHCTTLMNWAQRLVDAGGGLGSYRSWLADDHCGGCMAEQEGWGYPFVLPPLRRPHLLFSLEGFSTGIPRSSPWGGISVFQCLVP